MNNGNCFGVVLVSRGFNLARVKISVKPISCTCWEATGSQPGCTCGSAACSDWDETSEVATAQGEAAFECPLSGECVGISSGSYHGPFVFFSPTQVPDAVLPGRFVSALVLVTWIQRAAISVCHSACTDRKIRAQTRDLLS